jgi:hypothetical protein
VTTTAHAESAVIDLTACETAEAMMYYTEEAYLKNRDRNTVRAETKGACIYDTMMVEFGKTISHTTNKGIAYQVVKIKVQAMAKYGVINPPKPMFAMKYFKVKEEEV